MKFCIKNGLPIVSIDFTYQGSNVHLERVLVDTGCAVSIFDVDAVEVTELTIDPIDGIVKRMYGIGGQSELCYEQKLQNIKIGSFNFSNFTLQLGMTREPYGFDGILGSDYFLKSKSMIDYANLKIFNDKKHIK